MKNFRFVAATALMAAVALVGCGSPESVETSATPTTTAVESTALEAVTPSEETYPVEIESEVESETETVEATESEAVEAPVDIKGGWATEDNKTVAFIESGADNTVSAIVVETADDGVITTHQMIGTVTDDILNYTQATVIVAEGTGIPDVQVQDAVGSFELKLSDDGTAVLVWIDGDKTVELSPSDTVTDAVKSFMGGSFTDVALPSDIADAVDSANIPEDVEVTDDTDAATTEADAESVEDTAEATDTAEDVTEEVTEVAE